MRPASRSLPLLCIAVTLASCVSAAPAQGGLVVANEHTRVQAIGQPGKWTGVTVSAGGQEVTRVELSSAARWTASRAHTGGDAQARTLTLEGFSTAGTGGTPSLDGDSFVRFTLRRDDPFPRVDFRLKITGFDREAWEKAWGEKCPVYFLRCANPTAEIYYFHGLLAPTPTTDPYPFSWRDMRANWADGWSTAPALGALTVPAVALWTPTSGRVVGYTFQDARSTDKSDDGISVACCRGTRVHPGQFFALIWPFQRGWNELTYPTPPTTVASHFDLLYDLNTGPTSDVNRLVFDHLWQHYRDLLPPVPRMNHLGWMVERNVFPESVDEPHVFGRVHRADGGFASIFFKDNAELFGGDFRAVDHAYRTHNEAALTSFRAEAEKMLSRAIWETIGGEECVYWKYPSEGGWEDWIGDGRADTTHNVQQFGFAGALLAMYLHEPSDRLWRYVVGCYHWARHYIYTRGDICDIPCSMFTLQTSQLAMNFLMNLHYSLRDDADPRKREMAQEAFRLAETVVWRNANVTTDDPDETDWLDPSFLMPGNQARPWLGQVSWAELCDVFRSMIVMYGETGDERFKYYVRGALDRWYTGFQWDGYHTDENFDVFGQIEGKGVRTGLHGPQDSFWEWAQPVGNALLHVTGGRKAAIAFCGGTPELDVADYRFREPANFAFRVTGEYDKPFAMIFSSPFRDLSGLKVRVNGEESPAARLAGAYHEHLIFEAKAGAAVEIGEIGNAPVPKQPASVRPGFLQATKWTPSLGMDCLDLAPDCNATLDLSWQEPNSWAGLPGGRGFAYGVPYFIVDPEVARGKIAAEKRMISVTGRAAGVFLVSTRLGQNELGVALTTGAVLLVDPASGIRVRDGHTLRKWELWLYPVVPPDNSDIQQIAVGGQAKLFAVTVERRRPDVVAEVVRRIAAAQAEERAAREARAAEDRTVVDCAKRVRAQLDGKALRAGLLPPFGPAVTQVAAALERLGIPFQALRPEEVVDPSHFSAAAYPILVYTGVEDYLRTVKQPGDGEAALLRYVREGGTLLVMGPCRPFTYADDLSQPASAPNQRPWGLFGKQIGLDLLGPGEERDGAVGFEQPPMGALAFRPEPDQRVLSKTGLPETIPFPSTGDRRYRPAVAEPLEPGDRFQPILTLQGAGGKPYGPAMALIERPQPGGVTARILWVWGTLVGKDFPLADRVLFESLTAAAELCSPAAPTVRGTAGPPDRLGAAVGILPLASEDRTKLVEKLSRDRNVQAAPVSPEAFVDPATFTPDRYPVAVYASEGEQYLRTWRLPGDGERAYQNYLQQGGFLIACGNATQFWYAMDYLGGEWRSFAPLEPLLQQALGLPTLQGFEKPPNGMKLKLVDGQEVLQHLEPITDVTGIRDQRWRALMRTRSATRQFTPLAVLTDADGNRLEGYAAALIRQENEGRPPGTILYLWGNLIDGELGEKIMGDALDFALRDVQKRPE